MAQGWPIEIDTTAITKAHADLDELIRKLEGIPSVPVRTRSEHPEGHGTRTAREERTATRVRVALDRRRFARDLDHEYAMRGY